MLETEEPFPPAKNSVTFGHAFAPLSSVCFARIPAAMREVGCQTVSERVLTVRLDGSVEYETSDGEVRNVQAGS
jgi:hypothetical protein